MRTNILLGVITALGLSGCVTHEVVVRQAITPAVSSEVMPGESAVVEDRLQWQWQGDPVGTPAVARRSDPLPVDLAVTTWTYRPAGVPRRAEILVESPRPWWQRFPADVFTDLFWPKTLTCRTDLTVITSPVPIRSPAVLDREAAARGYARSAVPTTVPAPEKRDP